jgi:hypothetical protein
MIDEYFQKALDAWVKWETHLRTQHGYQACIHGEGRRCPSGSVVSCNACTRTRLPSGSRTQ